VLILAHQGGWDEMAMVAVPLLLVTILLVVANRRASPELARQEAAGERSSDEEPTPTD
jgi:ABC-type Fe3+ transport system permease subunit